MMLALSSRRGRDQHPHRRPEGDNACFGARALALSEHMNKNVGSLSARDIAILNFEEQWWTLVGNRRKREAIREELGLSPTSFYSALGDLVDETAAARSHPLVIARLRRRRAERRRAKFHGSEPLHRSP
jgi:hypothetical protein